MHFTLDGSSGADTLRQGEEAALQPEGQESEERRPQGRKRRKPGSARPRPAVQSESARPRSAVHIKSARPRSAVQSESAGAEMAISVNAAPGAVRLRRANRAAPRSAGTAKPCQAIYGRCATSGQAERPAPPSPGGGVGHPGAVCRGEPQPLPSCSRRGLCLNPARAPAGGAEAAGEACRSRALLAGPGAAQPQRSGPHAGGPVTRADY